MFQLELWRCEICKRILGRDLCLGDGSDLQLHCWGCGQVNVLRFIPLELPTEELTLRKGKKETA